MSGRIILDASAALHAVLPGRAAKPALDALAAAGSVLAPDLFCLEVGNALWKYVKAGDLRVEEAVEKLEQALALVDGLVPAAELSKEALVTAVAAGSSVYDCAYAVLGRREGATILTADLRFANALEELRIPVIALNPPESTESARKPRRR